MNVFKIVKCNSQHIFLMDAFEVFEEKQVICYIAAIKEESQDVASSMLKKQKQPD